ncbi:hypothetical protein HAX54_047946, partial [Datura stramonium]|nr:hypothetical protein [Datura stramonium]
MALEEKKGNFDDSKKRGFVGVYEESSKERNSTPYKLKRMVKPGEVLKHNTKPKLSPTSVEEEKLMLQKQRKAERSALEKMEKTVEFDDNLQ